MDQINSLSYLDAIIKETLRIYCPVTSPNRVAMKDDVIPLSRPFKDKYGVIHNTLPYVFQAKHSFIFSERLKAFGKARRSLFPSFLLTGTS